jgi:multiple sugar transport system permease protein
MSSTPGAARATDAVPAAQPAAPRRGMSDHTLGLLMILPAAVLIVTYLGLPLVTAVITSLFQQDTITHARAYVGLGNFVWLAQNPLFWESLGRSIYWTVGNAILQLIGGVAIALLLHANLRGRNIARGIVLFPFIVPAVVAALIWNYMLNDMVGVINYVLQSLHIITQPLGAMSTPGKAMNTIILISVWKFMPFMVVMFLSRLQTLPLELSEAARMDGCGPLRVFTRITLPWLMPVIIVALLLRIIWSFNEFDLPFLLTQGGPLNATMTLPLLIRYLAFDYLDVGKAAAVALVMIVILFALYRVQSTLFQRAESRLR